LTTPRYRQAIYVAAAVLTASACAAAVADIPPLDLTAAEHAGYQRWLAALEEPDAATLSNESAESAVWRSAIGTGDGAQLDTLLAGFASRATDCDDQSRYWCALALAARGQWDRCLLQLKQLLATGNPDEFDLRQRAWVVSAVADQFFLLGARRQCRDLYSLLSLSDRRELQLWAEYQGANLDLLDADYRRAATTYEQLCGCVDSSAWRIHACALAEVAQQLTRIQEGGESDGTVDRYR
jgi:hypothetical protein